MAKFKRTILTSKAHDLIAKLTAGKADIKFTKIATSDCDYSALTVEEIEKMVRLDNIRQEVLVNGAEIINSSTVSVTASLENTKLTTGYYIKAIGLYANDGTSEILYSVTIATEADYMPAFNNIAPSGIDFEILTEVSNSENINIEISDIVNVSIAQFNDFKNNIATQLNDNANEIETVKTNYAKKTEVNNLASSKAEKVDLDNTNIKVNQNTQELETQKARIDTFTKLAEGSTTGDAELIDARISQSGLVFSNVGGNIRNIDRILNTTVLNYETIANYDYDYISANKDSNEMLYINYNIKKGDVFEIETVCSVNHSVTFTKSNPINKALNNVEVINTTGNVIAKRIIATDSFTSLMFWASDVANLRKIVVKKIVYNNEVLKTSKIGVLDNLFNKVVLINEDITNFENNVVYKSVTLRKGNFYRINVRTKSKNKYSLTGTITNSKTQSETVIINDTKNDTSDFIFYADKTYNYICIYEEHGLANNIHLIVEEIDLTFSNKGKYERIIYVAANDSSDYDKANADIVCTGTNDERIINKAVASLPYGGTIQLFDGNYYFDEFSTMNNSCVFFQNSGYGRTITIRGTTENKSFLSNYGVVIHVTEKAYSVLNDTTTYSVFNSVNEKVPIYQHEAYPNNVNFENFYLFLFNSQKKVVGINGSNLGSMEVNQVGVYNKDYFYYRFNRLKPPTPVEGCIGILSVKAANDEMARISLDCANAGGLWCGMTIKGVEHLIMNTCTSSRNVYGYEFVGRCDKTLTVINCADEGNTHLPVFKGTGSATIIDYCIERLHDEVIPDDPNGIVEPFATEDTTNGWKGFLSYRVQGNALGVNKFWKDGHGKGFKTVNLDNNLCGTTRPTNPDYLCEFFDTSTNKMLRWNGTNWVDGMGNIE